MGRLRDATLPASRDATSPIDPVKTRGDAISDAAFTTKRSADLLIEQDDARRRLTSSCAGGAGLLSVALAGAAVAGLAQPQLLLVLAAAAAMVPTIHAFVQGTGAARRLQDAAYERGFCQALANHAKRLGDAVGATDTRGLQLSPSAVIGDQLEIVYKDLDRSRQRLMAAGAQPAARTVANRMHERIVPATTDTLLTATDGRRYPARIADVSQSGVALKGQLPRMYVNEEIQVGSRRAKVVKVTTGEAALQFVNPILPSEFNKRIVL